MKTTSLLLSTLKEVPADAEIVSHRLMLRAGLIRRVAACIYTWLPAGLRVLRKIETLIRDEMDHSGAREVLMPAVQPAELWEESGRWGHYGAELRAWKTGTSAPSALAQPTKRSSRTSSAGAAQLQAAAPEPLPNSSQVPRRDPPALWRDAGPRIRDERRLLLPSGWQA